MEMEEIDDRCLPALIDELNRDFELMHEAKHEPLEILDLEEVVGVLRKSVKRCLEKHVSY